MDIREINHYVELLATIVTYKIGSAKFEDSEKENKLLITEGETDYQFVSTFISNKIWPMKSKSVCDADFKNQTSNEDTGWNMKDIIIKIVFGLSSIPTMISTRGLEDWKVFGMIDKDFDSCDKSMISCPSLFITDTHDLETLLLSTDNELLKRLDKCTISDSDIKRAFFIAYQLGYIEEIANDICEKKIDFGVLKNSNNPVNYNEFLEDDCVNIKKLFSFCNKNTKRKLTKSSLNSCASQVLNNNKVKKKVDSDGIWKQTLLDFDHNKIKDFWDVVNGHIVLSLIRYINYGAYMAYDNNHAMRLNRNFELDLINKYDYSKLSITNIYANMLKEGVV